MQGENYIRTVMKLDWISCFQFLSEAEFIDVCANPTSDDQVDGIVLDRVWCWGGSHSSCCHPPKSQAQPWLYQSCGNLHSTQPRWVLTRLCCSWDNNSLHCKNLIINSDARRFSIGPVHTIYSYTHLPHPSQSALHPSSVFISDAPLLLRTCFKGMATAEEPPPHPI